MGKPSRDKGARREREIVALHKAVGVKAERVPLSGAWKYRHNVASAPSRWPLLMPSALEGNS